MGNILYIINSVSGPAEKSSSLPGYQFRKTLVDNHQTTIISHEKIKEPTISENCQCIIIPDVYKYLQPIFTPIFIISHILSNRLNYDLYVTDQNGDTILPVLLLSVFSINWIILSADSPDGAHIRQTRRRSEISLYSLYSAILYRISKLGFQRCDSVILSDESELIQNSQKTVIEGGADCEKIQRISDESGLAITSDNSPTGPVRLVYVGNMYIHRGIDILLEAVDSAESEIKLVLIGPRPPEYGRPENIEEFQAYFDQGFEQALEDLDATVNYKGVLDQEDTIQEMLRSDIGVCILPYERGLPHFKHSYPIKIFEYMATGLPILCTKTPVMGELLTDPQLLSSHKPLDVAADIDRLAEDHACREGCSSNNLKRVGQHCWESLREDLNQKIENTINS